MTPRQRRSDKLLGVLDEYDSVVVATHDTPDPDAIASGWAVHTLIRERLNKPVRLVGRGAIVRAENVRMVELLKPPLELLDSFTPPPGTAAVLVDCSPGGSNQLFFSGDAKPVAVIDHHVVPGPRWRVRFRDLRPKASASATIVSTYLREQGLEPGRDLATALYYAMHTEVVATPANFTTTDRGVFAWLAKWVDHQLLRQIADAPLSRAYFGDLSLAIASTRLYGDAAFSMLAPAGSQEIVGEIADLLIRCIDVHRVFCGAIVETGIVCSTRTTSSGGDAVELIGKVLKGMGHWGGHPHRAGGQIPLPGGSEKVPQSLVDEVRARWLAVCGVGGTKAARLVMRKAPR